MDSIVGLTACGLRKKHVLTVTKLTPSEQVQRSRVKRKIINEEPSWSNLEIKLHLAEKPELWVGKSGRSSIEYGKRLMELQPWCDHQIVLLQKRLAKQEKKNN